MTPEQQHAWGLFRDRHRVELEHYAYTVSEQSGVDENVLYDQTIDVLERKWPEKWVTEIPDVEHPPAFKAEFRYAKTIMANEFKSLLRERRHLEDQAVEDWTLDQQRSVRSLQWDQDPELIAIRKDQANRIYELCRQLPERDNLIFIMRATLDIPPAEVGKALRLERRQVNLIYHRATLKLRELAKREGLL